MIGKSVASGIFFCVGTTLVAMAAVLKVPENYSTIQLAIDAAASGDTVLVSQGTYHENINFHGKSINVKAGALPELVVIDGSTSVNPDSGSTVVFVSGESASSILDGFTITGGTGTSTNVGNRGGGILCANANPTIKNCTIKGNSAGAGGAVGLWHVDYQHKDHTQIENCIIAHNTASSEYGGGVWAGYQTVDIQQCTIVDNRPVNFTASSFGMGSTLTNSILWYGPVFNTAPPDVNYCDVEGGWPSGTGNIQTDPLFCDPAAGDYHLAANSPCIGNGQDGATMGALGQGCGAMTIIKSEQTHQQDFLLLDNYPNPFNPSTTISFSIPRRSVVQLDVYDILGRHVSSLVNEERPAGVYSIVYNADGLSSGMYYYRLRADNFKDTKRIVLVK